MKISEFLSSTIIVNPRKGKFNASTLKRLEEDVDQLCQLFREVDFEVFLTGGVGLAMHQDRFYRYHKDIDMAIFKEDLPKLSEYLNGRGYRVVKRYFMTHLSPRLDMHIVAPFDINRIGNEIPISKKIRGLQSGSRYRYRSSRVMIFDVFLWQRSGNGVVPVGYDTIIPWEDFYPATKARNDTNLLLPNINHKKHLPPRVRYQLIDYEVAGLNPIKNMLD
jgi:hypothetical protein